MFELRKQNAKVSHVNLREEKHGEDDVLACDLKVDAKMHNDFLDRLQEGLKTSLYKQASQVDLDTNHLPALRYPLLVAPLKWEGKIVGGKVTIHAPISDDDMVLFADIGELRINPQDGGTVGIAFRVQFIPDDSQASRLPHLLGKLVEISIEKPVADEGLAGDGGTKTGDDESGDGESD